MTTKTIDQLNQLALDPAQMSEIFKKLEEKLESFYKITYPDLDLKIIGFEVMLKEAPQNDEYNQKKQLLAYVLNLDITEVNKIYESLAEELNEILNANYAIDIAEEKIEIDVVPGDIEPDNTDHVNWEPPRFPILQPTPTPSYPRPGYYYNPSYPPPPPPPPGYNPNLWLHK